MVEIEMGYEFVSHCALTDPNKGCEIIGIITGAGIVLLKCFR